mgnify:CR=1 FL=1
MYATHKDIPSEIDIVCEYTKVSLHIFKLFLFGLIDSHVKIDMNEVNPILCDLLVECHYHSVSNKIATVVELMIEFLDPDRISHSGIHPVK